MISFFVHRIMHNYQQFSAGVHISNGCGRDILLLSISLFSFFRKTAFTIPVRCKSL